MSITPTSIPPAAIHAAHSVKKLVAWGAGAELALAAFAGAIVGQLSAAFGARNVGFLVVTLAVMTLDLLAGLARASLDRTPTPFNDVTLWGGVLGKLLRLALVVVAALLDWTLILLLPRSADAIARLMPTTRGAFVWLIAAEASSVIAHVRASQGDAVIPAVLIRTLDRLRLGGREPPRRRHYDRAASAGSTGSTEGRAAGAEEARRG